MKKQQIIYRIGLGMLVAFYAMGAVSNLLQLPDVMTSLKILGYPPYFAIFLGICQLLAVIALLIPGFKKVKEWAFIGIYINLIGAMVSHIVVEGFVSALIIILITIIILTITFTLFLKRNNPPEVEA